MHTRPITSMLSHGIRHFIDHSVPPIPYDPLSPLGTITSVDSKLPVHNIYSKVFYPTAFSWTEFDMCSLRAHELGTIFGLDSLLNKYVTTFSFPFPPTQVMNALLRPILLEQSSSPAS